MQDDSTDAGPLPATIDAFCLELRRLRQEADNPSYAELAARIARTREAAGEPVGRARIARSTVYDVFRPGRRRLDVGLVRDILRALDLDDDAVAHWTAVARLAVPGPTREPSTQVGARATEPPAAARALPAAHADTDPTDPTSPTSPTTPTTSGRRRLGIVIVGCVLANLVGRVVADSLDMPLHLDMVGTAVSAIVLGPWWGALVGLATNGLGVAVSGSSSLPFALVNVAGALVWGYGVRRLDLGRTIPRFFLLNVLAAVACSVVATPILLLLFDGPLGPQTDRLSVRLAGLTQVAVMSVFLSNLLISLADKMVSGFIALAVIESRTPSPMSLSIGDTAHRGEQAVTVTTSG